MPIRSQINDDVIYFPSNSFYEVNLTPGNTVKMTAEINHENVQFYFFAPRDNWPAAPYSIFTHNFNKAGDLDWKVASGYSTGYVFAQFEWSQINRNGQDFNIGPGDGKDFAGKQAATLNYSFQSPVTEKVQAYSGDTVLTPVMVVNNNFHRIAPPYGKNKGINLKVQVDKEQKSLIEQNVVIIVASGCDGSTITQFQFGQSNQLIKNMNDCGANSSLNLYAFITPTVDGDELDFDIGDPERDGKVKIVKV